jgi:hypothetical protein
MTESITTAQLQQLRTDARTEIQTSRRPRVIQDSENYSQQVLEWLCAVLICLGLSFGCLATIFVDGRTTSEMNSSTAISIKPMQTK